MDYGIIDSKGNMLLKVLSQAQGTILYYNGTNWVILSPGTSGQVLKTNGAAANPSWVNQSSSALSVKGGTFTRDMSDATASVGYTGVGFIPKAILFFAGKNNSAGNMTSVGAASAAASGLITNTSGGGGGLGSWSEYTSNVVYLLESSGVSQVGSLSSMDADGFTISWVKLGSPAATVITIFYLAIA